VHYFARPTVRLTLDVPAGCPSEPDSSKWTWAACEQVTPAEDYVYSDIELCSSMRSYGRLGAILLPETYRRFRIVARVLTAGQEPGQLLGHGTWVWDPDAHLYRPFGDLWIAWHHPNDLPPTMRRQLPLWAGETGGQRCKNCPVG
jgi:hypothetical protein